MARYNIAPARGRSKRVRETEAEAVAFVVCTAIGLETGSTAQDYTGLYGGDAKLLSESLEYIQRTATKSSTLSARMNHPRRPPDGGSKPKRYEFVNYAFGGVGRSWRIIQLMPNRSRTWPKREAKNSSRIGIKT